jgi:AraC-like DNA-binding protein
VAPAESVSTRDFFRLWSAAEDLFDGPAGRGFGLALGAGGVDGGYATASAVALHAPDVASALAAIARYKRLTCPEVIDVEVTGGEARVSYRFTLAEREVPRILVDAILASHHELLRRATGGRVRPIRIELSRREQDRALLGAHFGCPVRFGCTSDALVIPRAALAERLVTADTEAFGSLTRGLERDLRASEAAFLGEVRVAVARQLSGGLRPSLSSVARRLGLSARTLQRRLLEQRTGFHEQLSAVRRAAASRLLRHTDLDPVAISMLLGFAEPNSFARAFRAWEQTTPLRYRERLGAGPGARGRERPA